MQIFQLHHVFGMNTLIFLMQGGLCSIPAPSFQSENLIYQKADIYIVMTVAVQCHCIAQILI